MPYIEKKLRNYLVESPVGLVKPKDAGELNFVLTTIVHNFLKRNGSALTGYQARYQDYNDAIGALEGAKLELYRRHIAPYEDKKITENGDV